MQGCSILQVLFKCKEDKSVQSSSLSLPISGMKLTRPGDIPGLDVSPCLCGGSLRVLWYFLQNHRVNARGPIECVTRATTCNRSRWEEMNE